MEIRKISRRRTRSVDDENFVISRSYGGCVSEDGKEVYKDL